MSAEQALPPELDLGLDGTLLVFGGPYSNLRATKAIQAEADRLGIVANRVICTGDVVAYCAEPEETSQAIAAWGCHVIQGNCEQQLAAAAPDCACNFEAGSACDLLAKGWYPFASARISSEMRDWMGGLPETLRFNFAGRSFRVVHGGVSQVNRWIFASQADVIADECRDAKSDVVIAGHCGVPFVRRAGRSVWFNPGVVGMPANDGTTDVWYGLIRSKDGALQISTHRLSYDHVAAAAAMRRFGHANGYARTIVTGVWPSFDVFPEVERRATGKRLKPCSLSLPVLGKRPAHSQAA